MATNPTFAAPDPEPAPVVPINAPAALPPSAELLLPAPRPVMESILQAYAEQVGRAMGLVVRYYDQLSNRASAYGKRAYRQGAESAKELSAKTETQIAWVRRERPMEAIGIMCGIGVITGIALRVWRAQKP